LRIRLFCLRPILRPVLQCASFPKKPFPLGGRHAGMISVCFRVGPPSWQRLFSLSVFKSPLLCCRSRMRLHPAELFKSATATFCLTADLVCFVPRCSWSARSHGLGAPRGFSHRTLLPTYPFYTFLFPPLTVFVRVKVLR